MPHHPSDQHYDHLPLVRESPGPERRKRPAPPPSPPNRGGRRRFSKKLIASIDNLAQEAEERPEVVPGVEPHLVFRVPLAPKTPPETVCERLQEAGLVIVSIEPDDAVIAFREDADLSDFRAAARAYQRGPRAMPDGGHYASTKWDVFEYIEVDEMRRWGREDRIGGRLAESIGANGASLSPDQTYTLDVELWHRGSHDLANAGIGELATLIENTTVTGERLHDQYVGDYMVLARVTVTGPKLDQLLEMDIVASVEYPPVPSIDAFLARSTTKRDFPEPPHPDEDGPRVCIVDSGITSNHPLLATNVGHAEAILTAQTTEADEHGHGTRVGGLAVFGSVRACYEDGNFASPVILFSARVLNDKNEFDDEMLIITQMRRAIEAFFAEPHNCRVFNISIGTLGPTLATNNGKQTEWAESLDILAREYGILIVVSAGNYLDILNRRGKEAEAVLREYPTYLFRPDAALCEPATAGIPLVVGALAEHDAASVRHGADVQDIARAVASVDEPSPFTRTGPGVRNAVKPDLVHYGGNLLFGGTGSGGGRVIYNDAGTSIMSFDREITQRLFSFDFGTSYAAPRVARLAAMLWHYLQGIPDEIGGEPQANLVRALIASAASIPEAATNRLSPLLDELKQDDRFAKLTKELLIAMVCGYGLPDDELALASADRRVTLVWQGNIQLDRFFIFEVPIPDVFLSAKGDKRIITTLAFDPPVRGRRKDYLGVTMEMNLFRGRSVDEIVEAYRSLSKQEKEKLGDDVPKALKGSAVCKLVPTKTKVSTSTLQRREWTFQRSSAEYGDAYYLHVQATRKWAPEVIDKQDFAVTVTLAADAPELYNQVRQRIQARIPERVRARV